MKPNQYTIQFQELFTLILRSSYTTIITHFSETKSNQYMIQFHQLFMSILRR